jgi:hypothetical protein
MHTTTPTTNPLTGKAATTSSPFPIKPPGKKIKNKKFKSFGFVGRAISSTRSANKLRIRVY